MYCTYYDDETDKILIMMQKESYNKKIGDTTLIKGLKYKITGSKFISGKTSDDYKSFYVELLE